MNPKTMKTGTLVLVLAVFFTFCFILTPRSAFAAPFKGPVKKLVRGFVHIVASPFQLPKEIVQKTSDSTAPAYLVPIQGFFEGVGSGFYLGIRQMVSGFADIFTFWTPLGRDWGPIYEPASLVPQI